MRLLASVLAAGLALAACSNTADDLDQVRAILYPDAATMPARVQSLAQSGAPRLQVGFPATGRSGVMLREASRDGVQTWVSADGAALVLQDGLLRGTSGFGAGLLSSDIAGSRALVLAKQPGVADRFHTYLTGNDRAVTRTYRCTIENRGNRLIETAAGTTAAILVAERCQSLDQQFLNLYWVSPTGRDMLQSKQWTGPFLGHVSTRAVMP